jgi:adenine-specific DNA-methyltransferase
LQFAYNPHLPPVLRLDPTGAPDKLPELLETARTRPLTAEETRLLADALCQQEPWLEWAGKREKKSFEIEPVALHIHERISTQAILKVAARENVQRSLFADPQQEYREAVQFYQHDVDWSNRMILGDSLQVMASLARREDLAGKVQMIYMDPPYGIKFASNFQPEIGKRDVKDKETDLTREPEMVKAYRDTWTLGVHSYLAYLRDRLWLCKELLADSGSVFVQISDENLHRVRMLMDEVFGPGNFVAVINFRSMMPLASSEIESVYDYVLWYARDSHQMKYRNIWVPKNVGEDSEFVFADTGAGGYRRLSKDEILNINQTLTQEKVFKRSNLSSSGYTQSCTFSITFNGETFDPVQGKSWRTNGQGIKRLIAANRLFKLGAKLYFKLYHNDFGYTSLQNSWSDTIAFEEKTYVVQTTTTVIERCLLMTTDPGDLVLDPTCGSGTTANVAEQWGRRWITIDTSRVALALARQRLLTAKFDYYKLRPVNSEDIKRNPNGPWLPDPSGKIEGPCTFDCKTVPHITLKSIAQNVALDSIFAKHQPILDEKLAALNAALNAVTPELRQRLAMKLMEKEKREGKKSITDADRRRWQLPKVGQTSGLPPSGETPDPRSGWREWEVPFDADEEWPAELKAALEDYRAAWRAKMDEVTACIAANAEPEELVDQPDVLKGVVRVSGPFTMEAVMPAEESLDIDSPIEGTPEELETFKVGRLPACQRQARRLTHFPMSR